MKADTLDLNAVFGADIRYVVPLYQRPYVWNMSQHWEPLWNDVRTLAEQIESLNPDGSSTAKFHVPPHFLGALVVEQIPTAVGQIDARQVIDGQQRLTTLQLLILAARRVAADSKQERHERLLGRLLDNDQDLVREPDHAFKVWPTNADRNVFRAVVRDLPLSEVGEDASLKIANAAIYFENAIKSWLEDLTNDELTRRFEALTTAIRTHIRVVVIDLDADDNAQVIFETLNARGTPLQAADLIKNVIFQRALASGAKPEDLYAKYWAPFDTELWRQEVRQGRLIRARIDVFIGHWLTMKTGSEVLSHQLFPVFKEVLEASGQSATELAEELAAAANTFDSFERFPWDSVEGRFFNRQKQLDTTTTLPLLLFVFGLPADVLPPEERATLLAALESYLVRRTICRLTAKAYNRIFLDLLARVKQSPRDAAMTTVTYLQGLAGESSYWPSDEQVRQAVLGLSLYTSLPRARLRLILEALEWSMRSKLGENVQLFDVLTIEHVLPQEWRENWTLPPDADPQVAAIERDRIKHTLGNLTLVTGKLNPSLSNAAWATKRSAIQEHSVLRLNNELLREAGDTWDEQSVEARGQRLAEGVLRIWGGPSSPEWQRVIPLDAPLGTPTDAPQMEEAAQNTEVARAREVIRRMSEGGSGQVIAEALLDELLSWPRAYVRVKKESEGSKPPRRFLVHKKKSVLGAFVHVWPKQDHVTLIFRLPKHFAEGSSLAEARDVKSTDPYQIRIKIHSMNEIPEALELAQPAFDEVTD